MAGPATPTQVQNDDKAKQVKLKSKADLDSWLRDPLHPADTTTLHVHFIDYDTPRDLADLCTALDDDTRKKPSFDSPSTASNVDKLVNDIKALCLFTDGVLLSWSGRYTTLGNDDGESSRRTAKQPQTSGHDDSKRPNDTVLYKTFRRLIKDDNVQKFRDGRSAIVTLHYASQEGGVASQTPPCTHQLVLTSRGTMADTRETLITTSRKKGDTRPVVCVLVGGDTQSLKTAVTAVTENIPLIVMKGSGGFADLLALLYHKATRNNKKGRVHRKVQTVTRRVVEDETKTKIISYFKAEPEIVTSLNELVNKLQLLTVYTPASQDNRNLDALLFEALIKNNQEAQIDVLLRTMNVQQKLVHVPSITYSQTVVANDTLQLGYFIDSLLGCSPAAVSAFLPNLKPNFFDFHLASFLRLYEADVRFLRSDKLTEEDRGKLTEEDRDKPFARFLQARRDLKSYTGSVSRFPLKCRGDKCKECYLGDNADQKNAEEHSMQDAKARFLQTCLHPIQELFLWALLSGNMDVTVSLWKHCDDKMAAALFARAVYRGIRKTQTNVDVKRELKDYARRFEKLAVDTLKAANELDEKTTRELLNKKCPWWGEVSVLQLAMLTRSKLFIAQEPCRQQLTWKWDGHHDQVQPLCPCRSNRRSTKQGTATTSSTQPGTTTTCSCHGDKGAACMQAMQRIACYFKRPKSCYWISLVWQILFLALYSYVLLFDLRDIPSPAFVALMVWVTDTACEEMRQLMTSSMGVGGKKDGLWTRVKTYWSQKWNRLDVASVAGFVLGVILVLAPSQAAHAFGRVVLAIDVFIFFLRFLQILMVFRELGLLLVMAERMVKDSARFMVILLTVMLGYVVASESVLYPKMTFSWPTLYRLPSRAFGQTFADLGMQDILQGDCDKDGLCMSSYGQYLVPVMLVIYVIATHVLLLNLLIARFNATFEAVKVEAERHQAWQYCQLVQEYTNRSFLPPPCNILRLLITRVIQLCAKRCLCGQRRQRPRDTDCGHEEGECEPLISPVIQCCTTSHFQCIPRQTGEKSMTLTPSADGKCVTISSRQAMKDFTVTLTDTNNVPQSEHSYSVPRGTQRVMLWREDPTLTVSSGEIEEGIDTLKQELYINRWQLQKFEDEQAMYALSETDMLDNTQADTPAWATHLFSSIDQKIQTAVTSALDARLPRHTPAGSSEEA